MNEKETLMAEIKRVEAMLYKNEQLFDLAVTETDTEALIYEHKALTVRYSALLKRIRTIMEKEDSGCRR